METQLSDIAADLVELEENNPFLERLFSIEAGRWIDATALCDGSTQKLKKGLVQVTWLDSPTTVYGEGYCLIIFFSEELHWSDVALYNKQWFLRKFAGRRQASRTETLREIGEPRTHPDV